MINIKDVKPGLLIKRTSTDSVLLVVEQYCNKLSYNTIISWNVFYLSGPCLGTRDTISEEAICFCYSPLKLSEVEK